MLGGTGNVIDSVSAVIVGSAVGIDWFLLLCGFINCEKISER